VTGLRVKHGHARRCARGDEQSVSGFVERHWEIAFEADRPAGNGAPVLRSTVAICFRSGRLAWRCGPDFSSIASFPCVQNSADIFFDSARKRIYMAGGEGYLSIADRGLSRQGTERLRPILSGRAGARRARCGNPDLHSSGLRASPATHGGAIWNNERDRVI